MTQTKTYTVILWPIGRDFGLGSESGPFESRAIAEQALAAALGTGRFASGTIRIDAE